MARYQLASLGIGVLQDSNGNGLPGIAFTTTAPLYAAATGSTLLTTPQKVTGANGLAPGWIDPDISGGGYTISYGGATAIAFSAGPPGLPLNARAYGATGDGTTDDTAAIQAALDALPATGGVIALPAGRFKITAPLRLEKHNTTFIGAGAGQRVGATQDGVGTRIEVGSTFAGTAAIKVATVAGTTPVYGCLLRDFTVDGQLQGPALLDGILFTSNRGMIDHVHVHKMLGAGIRVKGTAGFDTYDTELRSVQVGNCVVDGVILDSDAADVQIVGGVLYNNGVNLRLKSSSTQVTGLHTYDATTYNVHFDNSGSRTKLANCKIEGAGSHGIFFDTQGGAGSSDVVITGCQFHDNGDTTTNTADHISHLGSTQTARLTISGCTFGWKNSGSNPNKPRYAINAGASGAVTWKVSGCTFGPTTNFGTAVFNKASSATLYLDIEWIGTPETFVQASIGSRVARTDGGAATSLYVKETGTLAAGWVGK